MSDEKNATKRNRWLIGGGVFVVVVLVALAVFQPWKLFVDKVVDEAAPISTTGTAAPKPTTSAAPTTTPTTAAPGSPTTAAPTTTAPPTTAAPAPTSGDFISKNHPTRGTALYLSDGSQRFVRFENFETDNGPDVVVYLSTGDVNRYDVGSDFLDLGELKGNVGNQNYAIPADADLSKYKSVVVWCRRFSVPFGAAPFSAS